MEAFPNAEMDDTTSAAVGSCLVTPVILRQVLDHISDKELIKLSLVNKQWNYEARSVLRDRGSLRAEISPIPGACQRLGVFASDLEQMSVVPFSGITMLVIHPSKCTSPAKELLDPVHNTILNRLPCKRLQVDFRGFLECHLNCPAFMLVQKILKDYSGVLEELTLDLEWRGAEYFQNVIQHSSFPRLRTLNFQADSTYKSVTSFPKTLVSRAPNLKEFNFTGDMHFEENILEGSSALLVPTSVFHPMKEQICESLIGALRPKRMAILKGERELFNPYISMDRVLEATRASLNRYIPMVLEASRVSLNTLCMNLLFAVPLMCYGVCLENVTDLVIELSSDDLEDFQPRILALLGNFDFTRVFPKLKSVKIDDLDCDFSMDVISEFVERGHAVLKNPLPDRAINIEHLELSNLCSYTGSLLAQMFPDVKKLALNTKGTEPFPFRLLWKHFGNLEELNVHVTQLRPCVEANLDGDFCGIFPEEVADLVEQDEEYLKAVNIVPIRPSICSMRKLRTFKLDLYVS